MPAGAEGPVPEGRGGDNVDTASSLLLLASQNSQPYNEQGTGEGSSQDEHIINEDDVFARNILPNFYQDTITARFYHETRIAYIGTTASNLAHLVGTQTAQPESLHYPFPAIRPILPWKPSATSTARRAVPLPQGETNERPQWRFLPIADVDFLPIEEIRERLVDAYFTRIHPGFPVIEEAEFRRRFSYSGDGANSEGREPPPLLLVQCVLLAGAHVCDHPVVAKSRSAVKAALYRRARTLFDIRHENDRAHLVQAALLLVWHTDGADDVATNTWYWSGAASRIAMGLGLHRRLAPAGMLTRDQRLFRRLWWTVVQSEVLCALNHGRPLTICPDECDQTPLSEEDFIEEDEDPNGVTQRHCTANKPFCIQNTLLCEIIMDIVKLHTPGAKRRLGDDGGEPMQEARKALNSRLATWYMELPPELSRPSLKTRDFWAAQLQLHYHTAVLALNRPPPRAQFSAPSTSPSLSGALEHRIDICNGAASSIAAIMGSIAAKGDIAQCWHTAVTAILASAIQISSQARRALLLNNGSSVLALSALERLEALSPVLLALATYWPGAEGIQRLFDGIQSGFIQQLAGNMRTGPPGFSGMEEPPETYLPVPQSTLFTDQNWSNIFGVGPGTDFLHDQPHIDVGQWMTPPD